jgi:hypothetical protein
VAKARAARLMLVSKREANDRERERGMREEKYIKTNKNKKINKHKKSERIPVHNKVDPQKLDSGKRTLTVTAGKSSNKGNRHGDDVDSKLELNEFANGVENVTSPQGGLHDGCEVVVQQYHIYPIQMLLLFLLFLFSSFIFFLHPYYFLFLLFFPYFTRHTMYVILNINININNHKHSKK